MWSNSLHWCICVSCWVVISKINHHTKEQPLYKCVLANKNKGCRILKYLKANILSPELYKHAHLEKKIQYKK